MSRIFPLLFLSLIFSCTLWGSQEADSIHILQNELHCEGPFHSTLLSGGLSGAKVYKVTTGSKTYVVRFWNMDWKEFFKQDLICQQIASDAGYGPKVYFTDEERGVIVMEYLQPEPLPETTKRLKALASMAKTIHTGPAYPLGIEKTADLSAILHEVALHGVGFLDLKTLQALAHDVYFLTQNVPTAPCHRDLHPGNIIYASGRFTPIDYTWSSIDDPYIDLAILVIFNCNTNSEEEELLKNYLGRTPSIEEKAHLSLLKNTYKLFYGLTFLLFASKDSLQTHTYPIHTPKSYLRFGKHGALPSIPEDYLDYGAALLQEVIEYAHSEDYAHDKSSFSSNVRVHP